jgi:hypothetical protein
MCAGLKVHEHAGCGTKVFAKNGDPTAQTMIRVGIYECNGDAAYECVAAAPHHQFLFRFNALRNILCGDVHSGFFGKANMLGIDFDPADRAVFPNQAVVGRWRRGMSLPTRRPTVLTMITLFRMNQAYELLGRHGEQFFAVVAANRAEGRVYIGNAIVQEDVYAVRQELRKALVAAGN